MQRNKKLSLFSALLGVIALVTSAQAVPIRAIPSLASVTFWERTGEIGPIPLTFGVDSVELTTRLSDPLGSVNQDFSTSANEFYDIFYSDVNGTFNLDGNFLSIEAIFQTALPFGGGLNLAETSLNFADGQTERGSHVASFTAFGDNAIPSSIGNAVDGDLLTHTTLGNTIGQVERLRITLGFASSADVEIIPQPEPATLSLLSIGTLGLLGIGWQRNRKERTKRSAC